jgi:hypothetical protein
MTYPLPLPSDSRDMTALLFDLLAAGDGVNVPTGRVVVQLHDPPERRGWAVQLVPRNSLSHSGAQLMKEAFTHFIPWPALSKHETLRLLARFSSGERGLEGGVKSVQVVTGDSLVAEGVTDEAAAVKHVTGVLDTAAEYATSIVALDVSSVADGQEEESSGGAGGDTKSFRIGRWQAWRQMLDAFTDKTEYALSELRPSLSQQPERARYTMLISTDERLTDRLADSCKSVWQDDYVKSWREHQDESKACTRFGCNKKFSEKDPNGECKYHGSDKLRMAPFDGSYRKLRDILCSAYAIKPEDIGTYTNNDSVLWFFVGTGKPKDSDVISATNDPITWLPKFAAVPDLKTKSEDKDTNVYVTPEAEVSVGLVQHPTFGKKYFPVGVYRLLCWSCCGRPFVPFDEPNGEHIKPKHKADKVRMTVLPLCF